MVVIQVRLVHRLLHSAHHLSKTKALIPSSHESLAKFCTCPSNSRIDLDYKPCSPFLSWSIQGFLNRFHIREKTQAMQEIGLIRQLRAVPAGVFTNYDEIKSFSS